MDTKRRSESFNIVTTARKSPMHGRKRSESFNAMITAQISPVNTKQKSGSFIQATIDNTPTIARASRTPARVDMTCHDTRRAMKERDRKIACQDMLLKKLYNDFDSCQSRVLFLNREFDSLRAKVTTNDRMIEKLTQENCSLLRLLQDNEKRDWKYQNRMKKTKGAQYVTRGQLEDISKQIKYKDELIRGLETQLKDMKLLSKKTKQRRLTVFRRSRSKSVFVVPLLNIDAEVQKQARLFSNDINEYSSEMPRKSALIPENQTKRQSYGGPFSSKVN
eukprot:gene16982-18694_t